MDRTRIQTRILELKERTIWDEREQGGSVMYQRDWKDLARIREEKGAR
jgi:hypothetical protein